MDNERLIHDLLTQNVTLHKKVEELKEQLLLLTYQQNATPRNNIDTAHEYPSEVSRDLTVFCQKGTTQVVTLTRGGYTYELDLTTCLQTNNTTKRVRRMWMVFLSPPHFLPTDHLDEDDHSILQ